MIITVSIQDDTNVSSVSITSRIVEFVCDSDEEQITLVGMLFARLQTIKHDIEAQKGQMKLDRTLEKDADRGF